MALTVETSMRRMNVMVLVLSGNLDMSTLPSLEKVVKDVESISGRKVICDFTGLEFMSSAGWGALVGLKGKLAESGGDLCIAGMNEDVARIHEVMGLGAMMKAVPDVEAGLKEFTV